MVSGYNIIERKKITMGWVEVRPVNAVGLVSNMYTLVRKFLAHSGASREEVSDQRLRHKVEQHLQNNCSNKKCITTTKWNLKHDYSIL